MLNLDRSIQTDKERVENVKNIFSQLDTTTLSQTDLESAATYILYGKMENNTNIFEQGKCFDEKVKYSSYKRTAPLSLDSLLESSTFDVTSLMPIHEKHNYIKAKPAIYRDEDSTIPGMTQLWESIDRLTDAMLNMKSDGQEANFSKYKLKHQIFQLRFDQYILKEAYKPSFKANPQKGGGHSGSQQFIDWDSDSEYWMTFDEWKRKIAKSLLPVDENIDHYETRINSWTGETEVKWHVRYHNFNWEDENHVRKFIKYYWDIEQMCHNKLWTWAKVLVLDFQRYVKELNLSPEWGYIFRRYVEGVDTSVIVGELEKLYGKSYAETTARDICVRKIPHLIALEAKRGRINVETPDWKKKQCCHCGKKFPRSALFFARDYSGVGALSGRCLSCAGNRWVKKLYD